MWNWSVYSKFIIHGNLLKGLIIPRHIFLSDKIREEMCLQLYFKLCITEHLDFTSKMSGFPHLGVSRLEDIVTAT